MFCNNFNGTKIIYVMCVYKIHKKNFSLRKTLDQFCKKKPFVWTISRHGLYKI